MRTDLKGVAAKVLDRCLTKLWQPTTRDIQTAYRLREAQVKQVKRYTKQLGAERGVTWGFDPYAERFLVVPANSRKIALRVLQYQIEHWEDGGNSTVDMFTGAYRQKYVTAPTLKVVTSMNKEFGKRIKRVQKDLAA